MENAPFLWISRVKPRKMGASGTVKPAEPDSPKSGYPHPTVCAQRYPQMWIDVCIFSLRNPLALVNSPFLA